MQHSLESKLVAKEILNQINLAKAAEAESPDLAERVSVVVFLIEDVDVACRFGDEPVECLLDG